MLYWLDKNSTKNNVIILSKKSILLGSCNASSYENVDAQLKNNANPVALLGKENISLVHFDQVQGITTHSTDTDLTIHSKIKNRSVESHLNFSHVEAKTKCLAMIKKLHGGNLQISEPQQDTSPKKSQIDKLSFVKSLKINTDWLSIKKEYLFMAIAGVVSVAFISLLVMKSNPASLYDAIQAHKLNSNDVAKHIEDGADIDYVGADGVTPLLSALNNREEKIAISLIEQGANLSTRYFGQTALDVAIETNLNNAVLSLLSKKATSTDEKNLLVRIIQNELDLRAVKAALSGGGNVNYVDEDGLSVLANALLFGANNNVVKLLLDNGASVKMRVNGVTPVEFAMSRGNRDLAVLLSQYSL